MKTLRCFSIGTLFSMLLWSGNLSASHFMGGEIYWECLPNGQYRFHMRVYQECAGILYSTISETLNSTVPSVPSITMYFVDSIDISPVCNGDPTFPHLSCETTMVSNTGGVREWIYQSDPVSLPASPPPATGWVFSYTGCCRNPCTNISGTNGMDWFLRAVMYPCGGLNASPCHNDSPIFAEPPQVVVTAGYPASYNPTAYDMNGDSIVYDWAQPLMYENQPITAYNSGYSYDNPLPGVTQNPSNIPASLDTFSGQLAFTSYTTGAFVTAYKVTEYRSGVKISEIFREMQVVILATGSNPSPEVPPPFPANPDSYVDSVYFGTTVTITLTALDTGLLNNNLDPQLVSINVDGVMMGLNDTSATTGCPAPPCAWLNLPTPISGITYAAGTFTWQTALNHLVFGGLQNPAVDYYFIFKAYDDYCPAPNYAMTPIKIVVMDYVLPAPALDSFQVDQGNGHVTLFWTPVPYDSTNSFDKYFIYYKNTAKAGWQLIDSIDNIATSSYTHTGVNGLTQDFWYTLQTRSGHSFLFLSGYSNILTNFTTGIEDEPAEETLLQFNSLTRSLELRGLCQGAVQLTIMNQLGQVVYDKNLSCNLLQRGIALPGKGGVYFYRMIINNNEIKGKILIP